MTNELNIETIRAALSMMVIGQQILIAMVFLKAKPRLPAQWLIAFLLFSGIAYLIASNPGLIAAVEPVRPLVLAFAFAMPYLLVEFSIALFEFRTLPLSWRLVIYTIPFATWLLMTMSASREMFDLLNVAHHIASLALIIHAVLSIVMDRQNDLLEPRRRYRVWFVSLIAAQTCIVMVAELIFGFGTAPPWLELLNVVAIAVLILGLSLPLLALKSEFLWQSSAARTTQVVKVSPSPADQVVRGALDAAMQAGVYQTSGLNIRSLAEQLNTTEHHLRNLINQQLGYRNFNAFLNHQRIQEARVRLEDHERVRIPVLTIAMELGYGSIGPFNRAFKDATGVTPTEFRRQKLG